MNSYISKIKTLSTSATGVLIFCTAGTMLARLASSLTMTRILTPDVFGLIGIVSSIFYTITMLTDLGFQAHVIRHPRGHDPHFQDAIWSIHVVRGACLAVISMLSAPIVAWLLAKPQLAAPLFTASIIFAIDGASSLAWFTAIRENKSRKVSLLELSLTIFQVAISILLALFIRNVWAIIFAMIIMSSAKTVTSYTMFKNSRRSFVFDKEISSEFWNFSKMIMASSFLTLLINQSDKFSLARIITLAEFGLYTTAITLSTAPQALVGSYTSRILYPVYSNAWRNKHTLIRETYYNVSKKMFSIFYPACGAAIGSAHLIIKTLYDPRYLEAGNYLAILMINTLFLLPNKAIESLFVSGGRAHYAYRANLCRLAWLGVIGSGLYLVMGPLGIVVAFGTVEVSAYLFGIVQMHRFNHLKLRYEIAYLAIAGASALASYLAARTLEAWLPIS